jgi:hypothetical protein
MCGGNTESHHNSYHPSCVRRGPLLGGKSKREAPSDCTQMGGERGDRPFVVRRFEAWFDGLRLGLTVWGLVWRFEAWFDGLRLGLTVWGLVWRFEAWFDGLRLGLTVEARFDAPSRQAKVQFPRVSWVSEKQEHRETILGEALASVGKRWNFMGDETSWMMKLHGWNFMDDETSWMKLHGWWNFMDETSWMIKLHGWWNFMGDETSWVMKLHGWNSLGEETDETSWEMLTALQKMYSNALLDWKLQIEPSKDS